MSTASAEYEHAGGRARITEQDGHMRLICTGCGADERLTSYPSGLVLLARHVGGVPAEEAPEPWRGLIRALVETLAAVLEGDDEDEPRPLAELHTGAQHRRTLAALYDAYPGLPGVLPHDAELLRADALSMETEVLIRSHDR